MQKNEFSIVLKGQLAPLVGNLVLQIEGAQIDGYFQFQGKKSYFQGKVLRRNHYVVSLPLQLQSSVEDCDVLLVLQKNNVLIGAMVDRWGCWSLEGTMSKQESWISNIQTD